MTHILSFHIVFYIFPAQTAAASKCANLELWFSTSLESTRRIQRPPRTLFDFSLLSA